MKLNSFLLVKGALGLIFGISFLLMPAAAMSIYGVTLDPIGVVMTRFLGACLIGIGLICLYERDASPKALQSILLSLFIADTAAFIVSLQAQLAGLMNVLGWLVVLIWLLLALGCGYFRFVKPAAA